MEPLGCSFWRACGRWKSSSTNCSARGCSRLTPCSAALPFFAIPFLAGGVSATQFICALAFLANGLLFCVALGLLASVIHREGGQAQTTALILTALLSLATPLVRWFSTTASITPPLPLEWLTLSPAYPPYLVFTNFAGSSPRLFWMGSGFTLVYSLTALLLAALVLQYTWREGPETLAPQGWRERWRQQGRGNKGWRRRLRARWLARNPFCWLAARDRRPALFAHAFLGIAVLLWLAGWAALGGRWLKPANAVASSIVLHLCFNWIVAYAAGKRLAEERQSGGFEVLLTVPLDPAAIVDGQCRALLVQFRTVWLAVLVLDLILCASGFAAPGWSLPAIVMYLTAWGTILIFWFSMHLETASRAMWISTWTGRPAYAALQSISGSLWLLFWVWILSRGATGLPSLAHAAVPVLILSLILLTVALVNFGRRRSLREKLARELRLIACAPDPVARRQALQEMGPSPHLPPWPVGRISPPARRSEALAVTPVTGNGPEASPSP